LYLNYKYSKKDVKINSQTHKANFVENHTRIKGIIYEWVDRNAPDRPWANICDWQLTFFVLYKGNTKWDSVNYVDFCNRTCSYGQAALNEIVFLFETDDFQQECRKIARVSELKSKIKKYRKELKELTKGE